MKIKDITNTQNGALYLADKITATLEELSVELEVPVPILMEDLVPHQPFLVAKMWTEDQGLFNSMKEKTQEAVEIHSEANPTIHQIASAVEQGFSESKYEYPK